MIKEYAVPIVMLLLGFMFIGSQQLARNTADNTANLPATNANVATNQSAIIDMRAQTSSDIKELREQLTNDLADLRDQLTQDIAEAEKSASDALNSEAQLIRTEINRREPEVLDTVNLLNLERAHDIDQVRDELDRLAVQLRDDIKEIRSQEFDHVNTPAASHSKLAH